MSSHLRTDVTLWRRWSQHASDTPDRDAIIHWVADEEPFRWTFSSLVNEAEQLAAMLVDRGIRKGDVCAIILRHNRHLYPLYLACVGVAAIPAILAYPNPRLHPDKFREGLAGMSRRSGLDWILTERDLEAVIRPLVEAPGSTIRGVQFPFEWPADSNRDDTFDLNEIGAGAKPTDPLLLQHSSGTTGLQKPVLLSHRAVLDHVANYAGTLGLSEDDKIASWLPLYHDMGLIAALHLPLAFGIPTVQIDPFEWVVVPSLLLDVISRERATISWLPNFAFSMMADKIREDDLEGITLDSWRLVINCSEPVREEDLQKFLGRFAPYGLRADALAASYAMAETTFAVTQTTLGSRPPVINVDKVALSKGDVVEVDQAAPARTCVSSGPAIPGCDVRIVDDDSVDVAQGRVGEIVVRSVSMFDGYRNYPEKTAAVLRDGWYYSGDYGFVKDGEYYVIGRKKDIVIIAGNNVYPEDVEAAVGSVEGVIPGRVIAFGEEDETFGSERLSVMAETPVTNEQGLQALRKAVIAAGMSIDVSIVNVYLVPPRFLIKSSAGKPSRHANKARLALVKSSAAVASSGS
jgi:acyl-CoA synthetase (AMP-forming)/AMP-acid ligase II